MSTLHQQLLAMWSDLLGKTDIRVTDDFYHLGGTSLRLIRMVGRIKAELGVDVFYGDLLDGVTVESLALLLEKEGRGEPQSCRSSTAEAIQELDCEQSGKPVTCPSKA